MTDFVGPALPPDDVLYRRAQLSREVRRDRRDLLKKWLGRRMEILDERYGNEGNYYVVLGDNKQVMSVKEYLA